MAHRSLTLSLLGENRTEAPNGFEAPSLTVIVTSSDAEAPELSVTVNLNTYMPSVKSFSESIGKSSVLMEGITPSNWIHS